MKAGIASFKIEGRARNANYVKTVVAAYRRAVDAVADGTYSPALVAELTDSVKTVFHREFSEGSTSGGRGLAVHGQRRLAGDDGEAPHRRRHRLFPEGGDRAGEGAGSCGKAGRRGADPRPTTGVLELVVGELRRDEERPAVGEKGTWVTFRAPRCRVGDKVFFVERNLV